MSRRIKDITPRFERNKNYAIGTLKSDSTPADVPERFASYPVKPLYISGMELLSAGMLTCRDYLTSGNCHFKASSPVYFYEVEYGEENRPVYKLVYTGTPTHKVEQLSLSDGEVHTIVPSYTSSESEKLLFKTQSEQIGYYQQCLQEERKQFSDERINYLQKIQDQNDRLVEKEIEINRLTAENEALRIRYEEANKYAERISMMGRNAEEDESPQGLADKGVALLDGLLGEGTSQAVAVRLMEGVGPSLMKLVEFGINTYNRKKGIPMEQPSAQAVPSNVWSQAPVVQQQQVQHQQNMDLTGDAQWQG